MHIQVETTQAETLMQLLDLATKAGGLQVAQQALPLAVIISDALRAEQEATPTEEREE